MTCIYIAETKEYLHTDLGLQISYNLTFALVWRINAVYVEKNNNLQGWLTIPYTEKEVRS